MGRTIEAYFKSHTEREREREREIHGKWNNVLQSNEFEQDTWEYVAKIETNVFAFKV